MMFYIYWRYKPTGFIGHGTKAIELKLAEAWIELLGSDFSCWLVEA